MPTTISGSSGVTFPAGGTDNVAGAGVGTTDTQTLTNKTLTSPTITGAVVSTMASSVITSDTAKASTSGTTVDFTGIPSWVKRITVLFNSISTNGTSLFLIQLGDSGGIENTGYLSGAGSRSGETTNTAGFVLNTAGAAAQGFSGSNTINLLGSNLWVSSGNLNRSGTGGDGFLYVSSGTKTTSATLDRIRITTVNGTDTFDLGSINIQYE